MNRKRFNYEGKWALITGASSGIGKTFGYELAARRANVILSSRSEAILEEMGHDIRRRFGVKVEVIPSDLATLEGARRLFRKVHEMNHTVQVLINNAGLGSYGRLQESAVNTPADQILLNALSPAVLAQLFLPIMVAAGDGAIITSRVLRAFNRRRTWRFTGLRKPSCSHSPRRSGRRICRPASGSWRFVLARWIPGSLKRSAAMNPRQWLAGTLPRTRCEQRCAHWIVVATT